MITGSGQPFASQIDAKKQTLKIRPGGIRLPGAVLEAPRDISLIAYAVHYMSP